MKTTYKYRIHDMESSIVDQASGKTVAECLSPDIAYEFLKAVNSHDALVEALKRCLRYTEEIKKETKNEVRVINLENVIKSALKESEG